MSHGDESEVHRWLDERLQASPFVRSWLEKKVAERQAAPATQPAPVAPDESALVAQRERYQALVRKYHELDLAYRRALAILRQRSGPTNSLGNSGDKRDEARRHVADDKEDP
jgi:hypothetical protein